MELKTVYFENPKGENAHHHHQQHGGKANHHHSSEGKNTDEDVIPVAGNHARANTAIVLKPVNSHHFFDLKIREILCKPHF